MTPRARQIADALAAHLPTDSEEALAVLTASLGPPIERLEGMDSFVYLPHVFFVAAYGLGCYPGRHRVEALVNGTTMGSAWFTVA